MARQNKGNQNRERQDLVNCLNLFVEPQGQPGLLGEHAVPIPLIVFQPTKLPLRQFEFDQS